MVDNCSAIWNVSALYIYEFFQFLIFFRFDELKHQIVYCLLSTVLMIISFDEPTRPCRSAEFIDFMCALYIAQLPAQISQSFDKYKVVSKCTTFVSWNCTLYSCSWLCIIFLNRMVNNDAMATHAAARI